MRIIEFKTAKEAEQYTLKKLKCQEVICIDACGDFVTLLGVSDDTDYSQQLPVVQCFINDEYDRFKFGNKVIRVRKDRSLDQPTNWKKHSK